MCLIAEGLTDECRTTAFAVICGAAGNGGFYYDCLFKDNSSLKDANQSTGGAIYIAKTVKDCDFIGNEGQAAGAIGDVSLIDHCTFKANVGR